MSEFPPRTEVTLFWGFSCIPYEARRINLSLERPGFFAVVSAANGRYPTGYVKLKLLYLGQAFEGQMRTPILNLPDEVTKGFKPFQGKHRVRDLVIVVGDLETSTEVTQALFEEVEAGLILDNRPPCNLNRPAEYTGRPLRIQNVCTDYLKKVTICG